MYSSFRLTKKYLQYYLSAANGKGHGMHSPFVFDFILHVLNNRSGLQTPAELRALRKELLHDQRVIEVQDLGAGSRVNGSKTLKLAQLAKRAVKPEKYAGLLYRLVQHYQPATILELGTSLGLTTAYLSRANPNATITTIEGSEAVAKIAAQNFSKLKCSNIHLLQGNFDAVLPGLLLHLPSIDLAYIDGNHRYEPTLRYFTQLLEKAEAHTIMVFDDIHWSAEMEKAWADIKAHASVQYTIDLFFLGFVFFKKEFRVKQHFTIRY